MALTTPDWLSKHGGELTVSKDDRRYVVYFAKEPQYVVEVIPTAGKFGPRIIQSINGRRLDSSGVFGTADEAATAGMEALRNNLGW